MSDSISLHWHVFWFFLLSSIRSISRSVQKNKTEMPLPTFLKFLLFSTLISIALFYGLSMIADLEHHTPLLWWSIGCFTLLSIIIYFLIEKSIKVSGGASLIALVIINVLLKLVFSFGLVALYVNQYQPQDKVFIIPFLTTYLVFTIFETWFMNVQARDVK